MQHFISVCGLSLAWVTSENSTSTGMPISFDSIFFAGPYLVCYCLRSRPHLSVVPRQLSLLSSRQLPLSSFVQPTLIRVPLPLPDTARFQVPKSFVCFGAKPDKRIVCSGHPYSATPWRPTESDKRKGGVARDGQGYLCWWHGKMMIMKSLNSATRSIDETLIGTANPGYIEPWQWRDNLVSPKLRDWSLTSRCNLVSYPGHLLVYVWKGLLFCLAC